MFDIFFIILSVLGFGLVLYSLYEANPGVLALGGIIIAVVGLMLLSTGYEQINEALITKGYAADGNVTYTIEDNYVAYTAAEYTNVWVIGWAYFGLGMFCVLLIIGDNAYKYYKG